MRFIILTITILFSVTSFSQSAHKVSLIEYMKEIQIWKTEANNMSLTFWIPTSYWRIALENNPQVEPETITQIESVFGKFVFLCALDFVTDIDGVFTFTKEPKLRKSISIEDGEGNVYLPLKPDELSEDAIALSQAMKPMFEQTLGKMGKGMHLYFFEVKDIDGTNIIDEYKEGKFVIKHSNKDFEFSLPLVTLLPPKKCPVDNAEMKGNWNYCPIHGAKLLE